MFINAISVNISGPKMTCLPMSQCGPKGSQIVQNDQFYHLGPVLAYLALRTFSENNFRLKDRECFLAKVLSSKKRTCAKHLPSRTEDHHTALWVIAQPDLIICILCKHTKTDICTSYCSSWSLFFGYYVVRQKSIKCCIDMKSDFCYEGSPSTQTS